MFPQTSTPFDLTNNIPIRGLCDQLNASSVIPLRLQLVVETDKIFCNGQNRTKIGNGIDTIPNLPYTVWEPLYDFGTFSDPNNNTPIDAGEFDDPAINFLLDFCVFSFN